MVKRRDEASWRRESSERPREGIEVVRCSSSESAKTASVLRVSASYICTPSVAQVKSPARRRGLHRFAVAGFLSCPALNHCYVRFISSISTCSIVEVTDTLLDGLAHGLLDGRVSLDQVESETLRPGSGEVDELEESASHVLALSTRGQLSALAEFGGRGLTGTPPMCV